MSYDANNNTNTNPSSDSTWHFWNIRRDFGSYDNKDKEDLTESQRQSYNDFLQRYVPYDQRQSIGLQAIFEKTFPVWNHNKMVELQFLHYDLLDPKDSVQECKDGDLTYCCQLRARFKRIIYKVDELTKEKTIDDVCEQDVFLGAIPLMTDQATFVITGVERAVIFQLHRAPGVFFEFDSARSTKGAFVAKVIPNAGSWLEMECNCSKHEFYTRIDKKKKISTVAFLMCLDGMYDMDELTGLERTGMSKAEILSIYYPRTKATRIDDGWVMDFAKEYYTDQILPYNLVSAHDRTIIGRQGTRCNRFFYSGQLYFENLHDHYLSNNVIDTASGQIIATAGEQLTPELMSKLSDMKEISVLVATDLAWRNAVVNEPSRNRAEALTAFYRIFRPGESPSINVAYELLQNVFFRHERYDLSKVGRMRLNQALDIKETSLALTRMDVLKVARAILSVRDGDLPVHDIDSLEHRRIRPAAEMLEAQCLTAMTRIKRLVRDKMNIVDVEQTKPYNLFNSLLFMSAVREFFSKSQLSQFLEHTNPLSALIHVRKVSSLGPGGLQSSNAAVDARDIHVSSNGKLCAVATPEGTKVSLIHSLALNAQVDEYGFLQGMYKKVVNGVVTDEIEYLSAVEDQQYNIAYADSALDEMDCLVDEMVSCKRGGVVIQVPRSEIHYIDASTAHLTGVSASLIPWLESTDATRCLMAANMQGQALPLVFPHSPTVGTGLEESVMRSTRSCVYAKRAGIVVQAENAKVVVKADEFDPDTGIMDIYRLEQYQQSNGGTCINQQAVVHVGDRVRQGQLLADGQSSDLGELALGANVRIALLSHTGAYEDAIVASQRLLKDDVFSSIHIQELEVAARETKLGEQKITADIPGIDAEHSMHLDESGIVQKGTQVKPGMILVGRTTPILDIAMSGEDRLIRAIFKNAAANIKNESLYVPAGISGTVVDVKVFTKRNYQQTERSIALQHIQLNSLKQELALELEELRISFSGVFRERAVGSKLAKPFGNLKKGHILRDEDDFDITAQIECKEPLVEKYERAVDSINQKFKNAADKIISGVDLQPGVLKIVKIYIATKRNLQPGDKLTGRYANKGVVSYCLPEEQMPYTADGKPVDLVLTPLGIVSRMNLGQIYEVHLGRASMALSEKLLTMLQNNDLARTVIRDIGKALPQEQVNCVIQTDSDAQIRIDSMSAQTEQMYTVQEIREFLHKIYKDRREYLDNLDDRDLVQQAYVFATKGIKFACPVFSGAKQEDLEELLLLAGSDISGKEILYDGRTGKPIDSAATVGYMHILKLHHLVDDKMHARSVGPYSSVTLQPLGGRAQDGGQRFGEMEVWAIQAYGSASVLLEMMTIKSDSVEGRIEAYKSITSGLSPNFVSTPAVFSVFTKELQALCLQIQRTNREVPLQDGWRRDIDTESISIKLQSPEDILEASYGEVTRSETINHRTNKTEPDGLFCQKIFGPVKDHECFCGKYKKAKDRGKICDRCGVEVTRSWVRRERMGHITLPAPVLHPWFYRALPSKICLMLDMSFSEVDSILNMDKYIVTDPGLTMLSFKQVLTEQEYEHELIENGHDAFTAVSGAKGILDVLTQIDLVKDRQTILKDLDTITVALRRKKLIARLKLIEGFIKSGQRPEWMVLTVIPVLPADLRPIVAIEAGRFASSDVNELYKRLLNRVNRLQRLEALRAPDILIKSEKRLLQEAVDSLFDNGKRDRPVLGSNRRPLKSLSDSLKGKQGIFRQNLLGKRVDYSGRSVIAVDAGQLKLHQCGIPRAMALELFKPFVYARLMRDGLALTLKDARRMLEEQHPTVWNVLKDVIYRHPVLLNRAPTLHRLSMRAFEPVLVDGKAIRLHPLVCSAYNADFDGDQMGVHVPLSDLAQIEARTLMGSAVNQLHPADGRCAILPSKDMILGLYYLTSLKQQEPTRTFYTLTDILAAHSKGVIGLQEPVLLCLGAESVVTCAGRVIVFNSIEPSEYLTFDMVNKQLRSKQIAELFSYLYKKCGQSYTGVMADDIMTLGFRYATKSGISFGLQDLKSPAIKDELIAKAQAQVDQLQEEYMEGLITLSERSSKTQEIWIRCFDKLSEYVQQDMSQKINDKPNPIFAMVDSGARGTKAQLVFMVGMKGLVVRPNGEILEDPIKECFKTGLKMSSFFATIPGVRKGMADLALNTSVAGYLTRRLVDVAQDVIVKDEDCNTTRGLEKTTIFSGSTIVSSLYQRTEGRVLAQPIIDKQGVVLIPAGTVLDLEHKAILEEHNITKATVRSILTCESKQGPCTKCYGIDLGRQKMVTKWTAIGVIAAQSISEPCTQLTMRSFHAGGGAKKEAVDAFHIAQVDAKVIFNNAKIITNRQGDDLSVSNAMQIALLQGEIEIARYDVPYGAQVLVQDGQEVKAGDELARWEPYLTPIITETTAIVQYSDLIDGLTLKQDEGIRRVTEARQTHKDLRPSVILCKDTGEPILTAYEVELRYSFNPGTVLLVKDGEKVFKGDVIAKFSTVELKSADVIAGLPMISQLFEASRPKQCAVLSEISGTVRFAKDYRSNRRIIIEPDNDDTEIPREHIVPQGSHLLVQEGHMVKKGDMLVDGTIYTSDVLRILGQDAMIEHFINAVQDVYRSQGISVNEKHIEVIINPMLQTVEVVDSGDSVYLTGERVDKEEFDKVNAQLEEGGKKLAYSRPYLQGISDRTYNKFSLAAAAFQDPVKFIASAACKGKKEQVNDNIKTSMMIGVYTALGTGGYIYELHHKKMQRIHDDKLSGLVATAA